VPQKRPTARDVETSPSLRRDQLSFSSAFGEPVIPGTCVQYPGLQGGGALGDASTPGTPADSIAACAHGGTYSYVAVAGETWGGEKGAAAGTAAAAARRRRATPTGGAFTPPRSAPLTAPVDGRPTGRRNRSRRAGTITRGSSWARSTPVVAARGRRAQLGAVGGGRGAGTVRALWPLWQDSPSQPLNSIRF